MPELIATPPGGRRVNATPASTVHEIATAYGYALQELTPAQVLGTASAVFFLGTELVLKVAHEGSSASLAKEVAILSFLGNAGIPVPSVIEHGQGSQEDIAYAVLRRCAGVSASTVRAGPSLFAAYADLGQALALLHSVHLPQSLRMHVSDRVRQSPVAALHMARRSGFISAADHEWLVTWMDNLERLIPESPQHVLTHGDASPNNLLVAGQTPYRLTCIVDWGDVAFDDPAADLAKMPFRTAPAVLRGYLGRTDEADAIAWAARVLRYHISWAAFRLGSAPKEADYVWNAAPSSRLLDVVRFFLDTHEESWRQLAPPS